VLHKSLAILLHCITFHFENRASPNHFGGLPILECDITTRDITFTDDCPEIRCGKDNHLLEQNPCLSSTGNLSLAKKIHVFDHLDKSKLTHLLGVANVQTAWMHFK